MCVLGKLFQGFRDDAFVENDVARTYTLSQSVAECDTTVPGCIYIQQQHKCVVCAFPAVFPFHKIVIGENNLKMAL
jgi:hypothetical protein